MCRCATAPRNGGRRRRRSSDGPWSCWTTGRSSPSTAAPRPPQVAYELGVRLAGLYPHDDEVATVVTNAVNIANDLAVRPQLRVVVTGGVARARSYELVGPLAEALLPRISIDTLVLGVTAIDPDGGLFTAHDGEAAVDAALVTAARRTIVVADSSKIPARAFARICGLSDVEVLVTDDGIDAGVAAQIRSAGVDVIVVDIAES